MHRLSTEFSATVPLVAHQAVRTRQQVGVALGRLQVLRDMIGYGEGIKVSALAYSNQHSAILLLKSGRGCGLCCQGGDDVSADELYAQLGACIERLDHDCDEFMDVSSLVGAEGLDGCDVQNVFRVSRRIETDRFQYRTKPHRLLFHGTHNRNAVGILQRGILPPKVVVSQFDVERTDYGYLGAGMYFSPSAAVSARFCHGSDAARGTRVMFVARVAVGRQYRTASTHPRAEGPPPGYDSVVGIASTPSNPTPFQGEEVRGDGTEGLGPHA